MAPLLVTLSDLEAYFCCWIFLYHVLFTVCLHMNWNVHLACNFNCIFENGLLKVTASHVHCNISSSRSFPTSSLSSVIFHTAVEQLTRYQLT